MAKLDNIAVLLVTYRMSWNLENRLRKYAKKTTETKHFGLAVLEIKNSSRGPFDLIKWPHRAAGKRRKLPSNQLPSNKQWASFRQFDDLKWLSRRQLADNKRKWEIVKKSRSSTGLKCFKNLPMPIAGIYSRLWHAVPLAVELVKLTNGGNLEPLHCP